MLFKKQKQCGGFMNEGVNITVNERDRFGFNFNREVTACLPEYIVFELDEETDRLYFLSADYKDGYKVTMKNNAIGRVGVHAGNKARYLKPFVGIHVVHQGKKGLFVAL